MNNNKLIARFMGREVHTDGIGWFDENFKTLIYDSWNELMPVIEKIELELSESYTVDIINKNQCEIYGSENNLIASAGNKTVNHSKLEAVYNAVIEFIQWYNEQNKDEPDTRNS